MDKPLVTVFITAYNSARYIRESIDSIINQTYKNLEIIVIDDHSTDNTIDILEKIQDKRIKIIKNEKNMGIPYNRIKGVELAKGKYMAIMDADDISMLNRIEVQVSFMEKHQEIMAAGTYYQLFGKKFNHVKKKAKLSPQEIKVDLIFIDPILNPSTIIRLDKMRKHNINYNPNYFVAQDYGLWAEISKTSLIAIIPKVLIKYRTGHNNITKTSLESRKKRRKEIIDNIHNDLLDFYGFNLSDAEKTIFNSFFVEIEPILDDNLISYTKELLEKMKKINREKEIFNETIFEKILYKSVEVSFRSAQIELQKKIKYWSILANANKSYIIIKSIYFSLRNSLKKMIYHLKV